MGAAPARQFLLCIPMVAASWKMFSQTVGCLFFNPCPSVSLTQMDLSPVCSPSIRSWCGVDLVDHFLGFSERRAQKAAQAADARAKGGQPAAEDSLTDDDASAEDELDSDDGPADGPEPNWAEERRKLKAPIPSESRLAPPPAKKQRLTDSADNRLAPPWPSTSSDVTMSAASLRKTQPARAIRPRHKYEADGVASVESGTSGNRLPRRLILGLADLDSMHGRYVILSFLFFSFFLHVLFLDY